MKLLFGLLVTAGFVASLDARAAEIVPTGQAITPTAATGSLFQTLNPGLAGNPDFVAGQASAMALSPDGHTLLVLTSGYNRTVGPDGKFIADLSNEYFFVYDVSGPTPIKRQVLTAPDTFLGLAWAPDGNRFFVSGGVDDDVLEFVRARGAFKAGRVFPLGHKAGIGLLVKPEAAGLAVSPDGRRLLVANLQNDSVSLVDLDKGLVRDKDLRPHPMDGSLNALVGGTFPRAVVWAGNDKAYVGSERDREIIAIRLDADGLDVTARIPTRGQPTALAVDRRGHLFAAMDNTDAVAVIDTRFDQDLVDFPVAGPPGLATPGLGGAGSNSIALSPDGSTLLVSNGGENAVAVVALDDGLLAPKVIGLIPTGWYPTAVSFSADGKRIFVTNSKSNTGPVPLTCRTNLQVSDASQVACQAANQYVWQKEKAGFLTLPTPSSEELARLTRQVALNDHFGEALPAEDAATMAFLKAHIHHVIYVVKENRSYDQVLGDLEVGDGDPKLTVFPRAMTPNQHALARQFVDLDAFFDSGESSNTGWNWTVAARTNDFTEREAPVNYADRGLQYDQEGDNRNINVGFATAAERLAANPLTPRSIDILAGARDVAALDGPNGAAEHGDIWDQALKAGLTVRNWGFYGDLSLYDKLAGSLRTPLERNPWKVGVKVFVPARASLMGITDPYYRGFDQSFPDYWRFREWEREFDGFVAAGSAPNLMMVRLPHDHTGDFGEGIDGVNTVETEIADNDYALGLLIQKVAGSPFARDTLIFVVEDDAQDGPDHVDAHRSIAFVVGPYVRRGAVVSHRYATVNLVKTIEAVLGLPPMGLTDAAAEPMSQVFDTSLTSWSFEATVPAVLRTTGLPLPPAPTAALACHLPMRSAAYWRAAMQGQDFSSEDHLDTASFNLALWRGLKGDAPYPASPDGRDLRQGRAALLLAADVATDKGCDAR